MSKQNRGLRGDPSVDVHLHHSRHAHLLFEELCACLREASDPALEDVRPLRLTLSPDGGHAVVAYAVATHDLSDEGPVRRRSQEGLARACAYLRAQLAFRLSLRAVPTLSFTFAGLAAPPSKGGAP